MEKENNPDVFTVEITPKGDGKSIETIFLISYDKDAPQEIERKLDLTFIAEDSIQINLCMANSEEVRIEFRTTFSNKDLINYITGCLRRYSLTQQGKNTLPILIPYPGSLEDFWNMVTEGQNIDKEN